MRTKHKGKILIVDEEFMSARILSAILSDEGFEVVELFDAHQALDHISENDVDALITDIRMPGMDGAQLFRHLKEKGLDIPVIFLTAYGTVESAVQTMIEGAFYYFIKPPDFSKLKVIVARAVEQRRLRKELELLKRMVPDDDNLNIIGQSPQMRSVIETIWAVRDSSSNVVITGKTGTGKELIARALHFSSIRKDRPFVAVNCAAIPRDLIESELFGFEKGAFTGAHSRRIGRFEEASNGTLFLDEIGELEAPLQAKLLRALEERVVSRLGSNALIPIDFRLVSSTNRDLEGSAAEGGFREDLLYRINVINIAVPTLGERREDVPMLVAHFVDEFCTRELKKLRVTDNAMKILVDYHWPGNIRQLRNTVERAVVVARGKEITPDELPREIVKSSGHLNQRTSHRTLKELEVKAVMDSLQNAHGNKSMAAKRLGISRKTFYKLMRESFNAQDVPFS